MANDEEAEALTNIDFALRGRLGQAFPGVARIRWGEPDNTVEVDLNTDPKQTQLVSLSLGHDDHSRSCYDPAVLAQILPKIAAPS